MKQDTIEKIFRLLFKCRRIEFHGLENISIDEPSVLLPNHRSWMDPLIIGLSSFKRIRFMASGLLFSNPKCKNDIYKYFFAKILGKNFVSRFLAHIISLPIMQVVNSWECIPSPQTSDSSLTFQTIYNFLQKRKSITIFPEGGFSKRINGKYNLKPLRFSGAKIAYHFYLSGIDIPIHPVGIIGSQRFIFSWHKIIIAYGIPLYIKDYIVTDDKEATYNKFMCVVEESINHLIKEFEG